MPYELDPNTNEYVWINEPEAAQAEQLASVDQQPDAEPPAEPPAEGGVQYYDANTQTWKDTGMSPEAAAEANRTSGGFYSVGGQVLEKPLGAFTGGEQGPNIPESYQYTVPEYAGLSKDEINYQEYLKAGAPFGITPSTYVLESDWKALADQKRAQDSLSQYVSDGQINIGKAVQDGVSLDALKAAGYTLSDNDYSRIKEGQRLVWDDKTGTYQILTQAQIDAITADAGANQQLLSDINLLGGVEGAIAAGEIGKVRDAIDRNLFVITDPKTGESRQMTQLDLLDVQINQADMRLRDQMNTLVASYVQPVNGVNTLNVSAAKAAGLDASALRLAGYPIDQQTFNSIAVPVAQPAGEVKRAVSYMTPMEIVNSSLLTPEAKIILLGLPETGQLAQKQILEEIKGFATLGIYPLVKNWDNLSSLDRGAYLAGVVGNVILAAFALKQMPALFKSLEPAPRLVTGEVVTETVTKAGYARDMSGGFWRRATPAEESAGQFTRSDFIKVGDKTLITGNYVKVPAAEALTEIKVPLTYKVTPSSIVSPSQAGVFAPEAGIVQVNPALTGNLASRLAWGIPRTAMAASLAAAPAAAIDMGAIQAASLSIAANLLQNNQITQSQFNQIASEIPQNISNLQLQQQSLQPQVTMTQAGQFQQVAQPQVMTQQQLLQTEQTQQQAQQQQVQQQQVQQQIQQQQAQQQQVQQQQVQQQIQQAQTGILTPAPVAPVVPRIPVVPIIPIPGLSGRGAGGGGSGGIGGVDTSLVGYVRDLLTEQPIEGSEVIIRGADYTARRLTDVNGRYAFSLNPGTYTITATKPDYDNAQVRFLVSPGANRLDLKPKKVTRPSFTPLPSFDRPSIVRTPKKKPISPALVTEGVITWKQGLFWVVIYPPYKEAVHMKQPPPGARKVKGLGSAYKTITALGGNANVLVRLNMGAFEARVQGKGNKPNLQFKRKRQKTRRAVMIRR